MVVYRWFSNKIQDGNDVEFGEKRLPNIKSDSKQDLSEPTILDVSSLVSLGGMTFEEDNEIPKN